MRCLFVLSRKRSVLLQLILLFQGFVIHIFYDQVWEKEIFKIDLYIIFYETTKTNRKLWKFIQQHQIIRCCGHNFKITQLNKPNMVFIKKLVSSTKSLKDSTNDQKTSLKSVFLLTTLWKTALSSFFFKSTYQKTVLKYDFLQHFWNLFFFQKP